MAIKYKWLAERLKELIQKDIRAGIDKLPTEQELSTRYRVSRQTVRLSLSILEQEGLIEKKHGSGSYITGLSGDPSKNRVGILVSSDQEYIYPRVLNDIHTVLAQNNFQDEVYTTKNRTNLEREILQQLLPQKLRGLIIEGCKSALPNPNLDLYYRLIRQGTNVIFLYNYYPAFRECLYLKDDNIGGSTLLVRHLVEQGHRTIGGIFKTDDLQGMERYQGFMETMRDFHLSVSDEHISWFNSQDLACLEQHQNTAFLKKAVQEAFSSCTAIICYNDEIAYWLIRELRIAGYVLPGDLSVVSFDNTYLSNLEQLTLTTLSHKPHEMGTKAAEMMVSRLKGFPVVSKEIPWELVTKESSQTNPL